MGLVTFSTEDRNPKPGFKVSGRVVDLSSIEDIPYTDGLEYLKNIDSVDSKLRERLEDNSEFVDTYPVDEIRLHRPVSPNKIIRLEGCYKHDLTDEGFNPFIEGDSLNEMDWPSHVAIPPSATVSPTQPIRLPQFAKKVRSGVELAFVVGNRGKYLSDSNALDSIAGCLVVGDIALYDDLPGLFGYKSFDSALPLGPEINPIDETTLTDLEIEMAINGNLIDSKSTADWRFEPGELVASVSRLMTLEPGDFILTGDPIRTDRLLQDGDNISATIEEVGTVRWPVERESTKVGMRI